MLKPHVVIFQIDVEVEFIVHVIHGIVNAFVSVGNGFDGLWKLLQFFGQIKAP